jgi:hypothetical protein
MDSTRSKTTVTAVISSIGKLRNHSSSLRVGQPTTHTNSMATTTAPPANPFLERRNHRKTIVRPSL